MLSRWLETINVFNKYQQARAALNCRFQQWNRCLRMQIQIYFWRMQAGCLWLGMSCHFPFFKCGLFYFSFDLNCNDTIDWKPNSCQWFFFFKLPSLHMLQNERVECWFVRVIHTILDTGYIDFFLKKNGSIKGGTFILSVPSVTSSFYRLLPTLLYVNVALISDLV